MKDLKIFVLLILLITGVSSCAIGKGMVSGQCEQQCQSSYNRFEDQKDCRANCPQAY